MILKNKNVLQENVEMLNIPFARMHKKIMRMYDLIANCSRIMELYKRVNL